MSPVARGFPFMPLAVTLAVQTLATAAAYSIPAVAPAVARDLGVNPALVGLYISTVYGVGILSALFSPRYVQSHGAVRASQAVLVATLAMLATAAAGSIAAVALSAMLMGVAYGATAPASTHLLVPRTPPSQINLVLSLRQIGVPLAGMLAALVMPPLTLRWGWRAALVVQMVPVLALGVVLEAVRRLWDQVHAAGAPLSTGLFTPLRLLVDMPALRRLSFACFVYSGLQLCFIVFMTTQLTTVAGMDLVQAGRVLAAYQLSGIVARPIWGWLADHVLAARWLLAVQGAIMCGAALLAAWFGPTWPGWLVVLVCACAGATASGFTGIAYGEYARVGGPRRTEATGVGAACMFGGVMVLPALMSVAVTASGSYLVAYSIIGALALVSGALLAFQPMERHARLGPKL